MYNKIFLIGYVGRNPEAFGNQAGIAKTQLATKETIQLASGEKREETSWHNLVAYGAMATVFLRNVRKGSLLHIEGKVSYPEWKDTAGKTHRRTEIVVNNVRFLTGAQTAQAPQPPEQSHPQRSPNPSYSEDDLPF